MYRTRLITLWLAMLISLSGCATAGHIQMDNHSYRFNRSDLQSENGHYRIWAWAYTRSPLDYFGNSPAGIQMLLPAAASDGNELEVGKECELWVRKDWNLAADIAGTLWVPVLSGHIKLDHADYVTPNLIGHFRATTRLGPVYGEFVISPATLDDNVIR